MIKVKRARPQQFGWVALRKGFVWCDHCGASGDSHQGGYLHDCTSCRGKGYRRSR